MPDIVFYYVDLGAGHYDKLIADMIASVRAHMPEAKVVQLTDSRTEIAAGVDIACRLDRAIPRDHLCISRVAMQSLYMDKIQGPVAFVDPDIVFMRSIAEVFDGSFDVAVQRIGKRASMPYNTGLVYATPAAKEFFAAYAEIAATMPQAVWAWWDDQLALSALIGACEPIGATVERAGARVRVFDGRLHAPPMGEEAGNPYAIHYKGATKILSGTTFTLAKDAPPTREMGGFLWPAEDSSCAAASLDQVTILEEHIYPLLDRFGIAVQAGGNCGVWPKKLSEKFKAVYTFEPDPGNFWCLVRNVPEANVIKMPCALGSLRGTVSLAGSPANSGGYFVAAKGSVPCLRLDDLELAGCDLLYLDVEGYESFAIEGAMQTIRRYRPLVVFEDKKHTLRYGQHANATGMILSAMGYETVKRVEQDTIMRMPA